MAGSFFSNCSDFTITGGKFTSVNGNLNEYHTYAYSATADSYNSYNQDNYVPPASAGHRAPPPDQAYGYRQDGPARSQSDSATYHPQEPTYQSGYHDLGRQTPLLALPDPRMQQEEFSSAHFANRHRQPQPEYAPPPPARSAPPMNSAWVGGAQRPRNASTFSTSGDAGFRSSSPDSVPFSEAPRPVYSSRGQGSGQYASSPSSSWAPRSGPPHERKPAPAQTGSFVQNMRHLHLQTDRRNSSDDEMESSDSESEMPNPSRPPPSHRSSVNDAASSGWRS
ncbi:hypothetical protein FB45DRAFT_894212 [Roridomyces roridus]|uniref:Uncharacterized protein n=1 Tax=Roridomyces roridus TaxID=1738132 RepID=A0AAD7FZJ3_9AGAR|nr:hypothetical protein FB45DRAFT_894212 [Roridomyces roridus]